MSPELEKKLRAWIFLRMDRDNQEEGFDIVEVLAQNLDERQLYGICAGILLIDATSQDEVFAWSEELCALGVDPNKLMRSVMHTLKVVNPGLFGGVTK